MNLARLTLLVLSLAAVGSACAEVMDKEPSLPQNMAWGLISSGTCLVLARFKPWLLLILAPLPAVYFIGLITEIRDPYVGPDIMREAGEIYLYSAYGLAILVVVSIVAGLWWRAKAEQHNKPIQPTPKSGAADG